MYKWDHVIDNIVLYCIWLGIALNSFFSAPVLDKCLQTWSTPVLGPLWVSKSEGFSPKGVHEFLSGLLTYTDAKLKEAKHYQQQVELGTFCIHTTLIWL